MNTYFDKCVVLNKRAQKTIKLDFMLEFHGIPLNQQSSPD